MVIGAHRTLQLIRSMQTMTLMEEISVSEIRPCEKVRFLYKCMPFDGRWLVLPGVGCCLRWTL